MYLPVKILTDNFFFILKGRTQEKWLFSRMWFLKLLFVGQIFFPESALNKVWVSSAGWRYEKVAESRKLAGLAIHLDLYSSSPRLSLTSLSPPLLPRLLSLLTSQCNVGNKVYERNKCMYVHMYVIKGIIGITAAKLLAVRGINDCII